MSVLSPESQKLIEEKLVQGGYISNPQLEELKKNAQKYNTPFLSYISHEKVITNEVLTKIASDVSGVPYVNLSQAKIEQSILNLLPLEIAERFMAVPLGETKNRLAVAMLDANNIQAVDFLASKIGRPLQVFAASEEGIKNVIEQYKTEADNNFSKDVQQTSEEIDNENYNKKIKSIVEDSPISKALNSILEYASRNRASDVHIEPLEKNLKIRCRIDGVLREIMKLPKSTEAPLVSRIKILSNLKIDEHRMPQDGQFTVKINNRSVDLRIAISPVIWGEQVVIRLLDKTETSLRLEDLGYTGRSLRTIRKGLARSNGMILTSGPTGSGKTTSMYALLQEIKNDSINIVTLEDPVEYKIEGVNQIQINTEIGLTFANGLRSVLRQDPDVVMVGEIRDKETATLAIQAALTGHLVFSTLHTNSAAGILPRLLDMGIEPFLIASTVHTVIGQRLARKITEDKEQYKSDLTETESIKQTLENLLPTTNEEIDKISKDIGFENLPLLSDNAYTLFKGKETQDAPGGYKGRIGLYEVFEITEMIQDLVLKSSTSTEIQNAAKKYQGMVTLRQDGYLKALAGVTTLKEINRVASIDL